MSHPWEPPNLFWVRILTYILVAVALVYFNQKHSDAEGGEP